jgi:ornithine cyclodeaminase
MEIVPAWKILTVARADLIVPAVRQALIDHAAGRIVSPPPGHLDFEEPPGDCHIKFGRARGSPFFVIKVATGFYRNPQRGLPSGNGLMLVMSADTGAPLALLDDQGWLTEARTAAAGVAAVEACGPDHDGTLGILGAGAQAELQARWIAARCGFDRVALWSRNASKAAWLAERLTASGLAAFDCARPAEVAAHAAVIVTCTPAREPLLWAHELGKARLIVAMGADTRGKRELDPALVEGADSIVCDDVERCLDHGEIQGTKMAPARLSTLGAILDGEPKPAGRLTIVDLTGLPAQDIAAATVVWRRLSGSGYSAAE